MADIKLFRLAANGVAELAGQSVAVEKSLQTLIERNLEAFLGVRFVATEHATGKAHGGRIDTLGLDENNCPVIIEYKRAVNENVINQGLFYLNWLMDHKAEFKLLVLETYGKEAADAIDWNAPRLLCFAGDFTKYDEHAVQQIPRDIDLIRYRRYGDDLLLLELVSATSGLSKPIAKPGKQADDEDDDGETGGEGPRVLRRYGQSSQAVKDRYEHLRSYLLAMGDDVQEKVLNGYIAFRRMRNFAAVKFRPTKDQMQVFVNIAASQVALEPGFTAPERAGDLERSNVIIYIDSDEDLERAKPLILKSYEAS